MRRRDAALKRFAMHDMKRVAVPPAIIDRDPLCLWCTHYTSKRRCRAYPEGIPEEILKGEVEHEHREPYPGDHGIQFKEKR